jgi:hypothetical protein
MSGAIWTKSVKEGFVENTKTFGNGNTCSGNVSSDTVKYISSAVADFGNDVYIGKDISELILTSDPNKPRPTPIPDETEDDPSMIDNLTNLYNDFDPNKAKNLYKNGIRTIKNKVDNVKHDIAGFIASLVYENFESPEAKNDLAILSSQIATWFAVIPVSYLMVINWWYILAYTNYVIDFRDYIWSALHWVMAPSLYAFELLNYYTLTSRMDIDATYPTIETARYWGWNYRPIWFSIFHLTTFGPMLMFPVTDFMQSTMENTGMTFMVASIASIYYFFGLCMKEKWYEKFMSSSSGYLLFAGLSIASFLMMFVFVGIICPLFLLYTMFLSYVVLFAFNGFWPPSIMSVYKQMFDELKEIPVDDPIDKWGRLKNVALQNSHSIYLFFIMSGFFIAHVYKAMSFSNESLIVIAVLANLLICFLFAPSAFSVPFELLKVYLDDTGDGNTKNAEPGEATIGTPRA